MARHVPCPPSIVTIHLIDEAGHPTLGARDEILIVLRTSSGLLAVMP
jgi:hypothetical protein